MKHLFYIVAITVVVTSCQKQSPETSFFEDVNFEMAVMKSLDNFSNKIDSITIQMVDSISCGNCRDLSGIRFMTNLREANFYHSELTELGKIEELKNLKILTLVDCGLTDISFLSKMESLEELYLSRNDINDISPLKSLSNLRVLTIDENNICDISSISELNKIEQVVARHNLIKVLPDLSRCAKLKEVDLGNNDLEFNKNFYRLNGESFVFYENKINRLSWVDSLKNIKYLNIKKNPLKQEAYSSKIKTLINDFDVLID